MTSRPSSILTIARRSGRGVGLVYLLAVVGLVVAVANFLVTRHNETTIADANGVVDRARVRADDANADSSKAITGSILETAELLDPEGPTQARRSGAAEGGRALGRLAADIVADLEGKSDLDRASIEAIIKQARRKIDVLNQLVRLRDAAGDWKDRWTRSRIDVLDAFASVAAELAALRTATREASGQSHLDLVLAMRAAQTPSGAIESAHAEVLTARWRHDQTLGTIEEELVDLAQFVQELASVADESALVDLRDNRLAPTCFRLGRAIKILTRTDLAVSESLATHLGDIKDMIFGVGHVIDREHQVVVLGEAGELNALMERLSLRDEARELERRRQEIEGILPAIESDFAAAMNEVSHALTSSAQAAARASSRLAGLIALLGGALFLFIARRVAQRIRADLRGKEEANRHLDLMVERAEAAVRSKDVFLATMSHEIRTPMNGIMGVVTLLEDTPLDPTQKSYIEIMQRSSVALLTLINDILDFSKIQAGKMELESVEFDLIDVVFDVASLFAMSAQQKGIELHVEFESPLSIRRRGDPSRLRQVLSNLVGNAVKFTEQGRIDVRVRAVTADIVEFEIEDSGIGIPDEAKGRLFESFSQADGSTTRKHGGTGLGLAISRHLVEAMGGAIRVESRAGVGSRFHFEVRVPSAGAVEDEPRAAGQRVRLLGFNSVTQTSLERILNAMGAGLISAEETAPRSGSVLLVDGSHHNPSLATCFAAWSRLGGRFVVCTQRSDRQRWEGQGIKTLLKPIHPRELAAAIGADQAMSAVEAMVPITIASMPEVASLPEEAEASPVVASQDMRLRVLLAEDNAINQKIATAILAKMGCSVQVAGNGRMAVEAASGAEFDLVLMDCQMPEMDGFEATRTIRLLSDPNRARVPIIALTANAMSGDRDRCLDAGMDDYLRKPIERDQLALILDRFRAP